MGHVIGETSTRSVFRSFNFDILVDLQDMLLHQI